MRSELERAFEVPVAELRAISGGDLNEAFAVRLADGRQLFVKSGQDDYRAEAAGLRWLAQAPGGVRTPAVELVAPGLLALEWIEHGPLNASGEQELGHRLAALHRAGADSHGALPPEGGDRLRIGPLSFELSGDSWPQVYGSLLLALSSEPEVVRVVERLPELAGPPESPARLHGDLWSGNVIGDLAGSPYLIDPAAYGGHREVDLAMLQLFGGPGRRCFDAYDEAFPLAEGHQERVGLWQLFPLLVHARLFGGGYRSRAIDLARYYAGP